MHPILIHLGQFSVRTYGALVALAFLAALRLAIWAGRLRKIPEVFMVDVSAVAILSGLIGARVLYVFLYFGYFRQHPADIFKIWEGGLVFYGGYVVAAFTAAGFVIHRRMPLGIVADCLAPALALGQAIGRWGCFFAGCCYGRPTTAPWAIKFKDPLSLAPIGVDLHPVQIYESLGNLLLALFLWIRLSRHKDGDGEVFWFYTLGYAALRFVMETFRGDDRGPTLGGLSPSQIVALLAIVVAGSILIAQKTSHDAHA